MLELVGESGESVVHLFDIPGVDKSRDGEGLFPEKTDRNTG